MIRRVPDWRFFATLASISLIGPLAIHMYLPAMPVIKSAFAVSDAMVGLTYSAALLVMAAATLIYGSLSDRYGRRPVLFAGLFLFTLGSGLSGLADSFYGLVAGRVIQALGAACGVTLARTIARDAYGSEGLVRVIAYLTMAYTLGPVLAVLFGGVLIDTAGWRSLFGLAAISGLLITIACGLVIYETHPKADYQRKPSGYVKEYLELFSHARFVAFVLQSGFSSGVFYPMAAAASFLMKDYLGRSATEFSLYFMAFPIGFFSGNLLASRLSQRFGIETMVLVGSVINFVAILLLSALILAGFLSPLVIFIPGGLSSFGQGIALSNTQVGAMRVIPSLAGTAAGVGVFCQVFLGAAFAQMYSLLADGTPVPMVATVLIASILTLAAGATPYVMNHRERIARVGPER